MKMPQIPTYEEQELAAQQLAKDAAELHPTLPPAEGSPAAVAKNDVEIKSRPRVLPMNQRKWPYGTPDRLQPGSNF
jgi:hypothetical protein